MKRILVVGDSWAAGHVAEDKTDNGWPVMMGIPLELRQGVDGTTAAQWAADAGGMLTRALNTPCDCVVVSLMGNDAFAANSDGNVTPEEIEGALAAMKRVVSVLIEKHKEVYVLLYANPYRTDWKAAAAVWYLNFLIRKASCGARVIETGIVLADAKSFAAGDFHPSYEGHRLLAGMIRGIVG